MATDQGDVVDPGTGQDRISDLPDHLLHDILIRLPGTAAAARTSVLSRRWRRVWAHTPVISLGSRMNPPGAPVPDRVDAAMAAHAAGAVAGAGAGPAVSLSRLEITMPSASSPHLRMDRVAAWLLVAARRLAGELRIGLPPYWRNGDEDHQEVLLPVCEGATSVSLDLRRRTLRFVLPPTGAGVFKALATLTIQFARMHGRELQAAVSSSRCPCLKELAIERAVLLQDGDQDLLSICSDSLERLEISAVESFEGRLCVRAPELRTFHPSYMCAFDLVAPKLSEVRWCGGLAYDSGRHRLARAGHQLRRLEVEADAPGLALMRQFITVEELDLTVRLSRGVQEYEGFLKYTDNKLADCKVLLVKFEDIEHGLRPAMIHLLSKCAGIQRLVVRLSYSKRDGYPCRPSTGCPCSRTESCKAQKVVLDSLEEVVINGPGDDDHKVEVARLLCRCSTTSNNKVSITVSDCIRPDYVRKKILSFCLPNNKTEITVQRLSR